MTTSNNLPYAGRPLARIRTDDPAAPEGVGDMKWDAAADELSLPNAAGDAWQSYTLGSVGVIPAAKVSRGTQSLNTLTVYTFSFTTEDFDTDTMVDIGGQPTRITCVTAGLFKVGVRCELTLDSREQVASLKLQLGGADINGAASYEPADPSYSGAKGYSMEVNTLLSLTAAQYLTARITLSATGNSSDILNYANMYAYRAGAAS